MYVYGHVPVCTRVWVHEHVQVHDLHLFSETGSLIEPGSDKLGETIWLANPKDPPSMPLQAWSQAHVPAAVGDQTQAPQSGKHFIAQSIFLAPNHVNHPQVPHRLPKFSSQSVSVVFRATGAGMEE